MPYREVMYFKPSRSLYFLFLAISCGVVAEFVYVIKELSESSRSWFSGSFSGRCSIHSSRLAISPGLLTGVCDDLGRLDCLRFTRPTLNAQLGLVQVARWGWLPCLHALYPDFSGYDSIFAVAFSVVKESGVGLEGDDMLTPSRAERMCIRDG